MTTMKTIKLLLLTVGLITGAVNVTQAMQQQITIVSAEDSAMRRDGMIIRYQTKIDSLITAICATIATMPSINRCKKESLERFQELINVSTDVHKEVKDLQKKGQLSMGDGFLVEENIAAKLSEANAAIEATENKHVNKLEAARQAKK